MDPRQVRSRALLHEAVLRLAAEQSIADLSMTAIATAAGVHRSTVYQHAGSVDELLQQALGAELDELRAGLPAPGTPPEEVGRAVTAVTRGVLEHVARHAELYRAGLAAGDADHGLRGMLGRHFLESGRLLREVSGVDVPLDVPGQPPAAVTDVAARFIADGTVGVIAAWLDLPDLSVDDLLEIYGRLLPAWWPRDPA
ncbi:TetR/AcrR family transcriptional regulator [Nocardioides nitrophenolicus]|uniref:TetR/AcrR family transcriptional regulator n=1 Tax=Nocardioides nitrophenolicus TaxID=60489 RepID=UPI0019581D02|nr:TetR/AcrR family transcriptional regulator [Nocardioides nitrophenolicus]MBM7516642.1 AcrR family transcriptional regulator [Nocardioides nitrophenolicus]